MKNVSSKYLILQEVKAAFRESPPHTENHVPLTAAHFLLVFFSFLAKDAAPEPAIIRSRRCPPVLPDQRMEVEDQERHRSSSGDVRRRQEGERERERDQGSVA